MRKPLLRAALFAGAALISSPAFAQAARADTPSAAKEQSASQATAVEELVVTARRTAENVQSVPIAISAFSERTLDRLGATDATSLQGLVPNLNIVQGRGSPDAANIYLRGLGQPDALQTFDPAVGIYIDDVFISRIRGVLFNVFDLDRVEVLRGPQGTLYGKNTIGGAIRFITKKPGQTPYIFASAAAGDYGAYEGKLTAMGPVTDTLALGLTAYMAGHQGYVKDFYNGREYNNEKTQALRAQLAWTPTSKFRFDLSVDYTHEHPELTVGRDVGNVYRTNLVPAGITVLQAAQPAWDFKSSASPGLPNEAPLNAFMVNGVFDWQVNDDWRLKSITAYRRLAYRDYIDIDATRFQLGDVFVGVDQDQTSQEFQVNYEHGKLKAVAGFFYESEQINSRQFAFGNDLYTLTPAAPLGFLRPITDDLHTDSYAGYVNATYNLTDTLRISGGLRYSNDEKTYFRTTAPAFSPAVLALAVNTFTVKDSWDNVSGLASIDWQARPNALLYARYSQGFLSGGFNGRANNPGEQQPYAPETVDTYELGAKTDWFSHTVRANLTLFYNDFQNFQARVSQAVPDPTGAVSVPIIALTVLNAGGLTTKGVEFEGAWNPIRPLTIDTQLGYLDARYDTFNDRTFITATNPTGDRSFQTPAFSPEFTGRIGAAYELGLGERGSLTAGASISYRSRMALTVDSTRTNGQPYPALFQAGYGLVDARLVWESPSRRFSAGVYAKNLGAKEYKTDAQEFSSVAGIQTVYYGAPRTVMFRVTGRFY